MRVHSVLVTGGLGFVGARIVKHLRDKYPECTITVLDIVAPTPENTDPSTKYVQADVTSLESVRDALHDNQPQAIVHTAGIVPTLAQRHGREIQDLVTRVNVEGTQILLQAAKDAGVEAFIYTSSCCAVIDDFSQPYANIDERWPVVEPGKATMYGESKAQAERMVLAANIATAHGPISMFKTCSLRPAVIFGEGDCTLVPPIVSQIIDKVESPFIIGDGDNMWDSVYVGNVADAHVLALENLLSDEPTAAGEAFFIQNNEPVSFREFCLACWKAFDGHVPPFEVKIPLSLAWVMGFVGELYSWVTGKHVTLSRSTIQDAVAMRYASGDKARRILGYEARVGLEEGLKRSCQEYAARLRGNKVKKM